MTTSAAPSGRAASGGSDLIGGSPAVAPPGLRSARRRCPLWSDSSVPPAALPAAIGRVPGTIGYDRRHRPVQNSDIEFARRISTTAAAPGAPPAARRGVFMELPA